MLLSRPQAHFKIMKPDGKHTKEEILELIQNELQSWERDEICITLLKDCSDDRLYDLFSRYTPEYIHTITGYFVYEEEREDISELELWEFMKEADCSTYDLWEYIEFYVREDKIADWIAASKNLDKTVLLDHINRDVLIEYFNTYFEIQSVNKIIQKNED